MRGFFITLEGTDGSGKSTQAALLVDRVKRETGREVVPTREPGGGGEFSRQLRSLLLGTEMGLATETLLFQAARAEHARTVIWPALERGAVVICDRYLHSTLAMQGHAGGAPLDLLLHVHAWSTHSLLPDLTLFLDISPEEALARQKDVNRMEARGLDYQRQVRTGFLRACRDHILCPWEEIDARGTVLTVHERIWQALAPVLQTRGLLAATRGIPCTA